MSESADFTAAYVALCAALRERAGADGAPPRVLRDPSLAEVSLHDVPRDVLIAVRGDQAFVENLFLLFLDRVPGPRELRRQLGRLAEGATRDDLIEHMLSHPKVLREERTVRWR